MKCICRRSQTDGQQIENRGDLFHVIHPPTAATFVFLPLFHVSFYSSLPSNGTTALLSACLCLSSLCCVPSLLSVCPLCRLSGQSEVHATECAGFSPGDRTDSFSNEKWKEEDTGLTSLPLSLLFLTFYLVVYIRYKWQWEKERP